jgi:hypothetical protein
VHIKFCQKKGRMQGEMQQYNRAEVADAITNLKYYQKKTIHAMSAALGIPPTTIHHMY